MCDLVEALDLSQSVVSRHLAYLLNNGLAATRSEGPWVYYKVISGCCERLFEHIRQCGTGNEEMQANLERLKIKRPSQDCA